MYEGREHEINWDRMPPGIEDFPYDVQKAILNYGKFQDRIVPDVGFLGKDFTLLEVIVRVEKVDNESLFLEALLQLDSFYIKKSADDMAAARKRHGKK